MNQRIISLALIYSLLCTTFTVPVNATENRLTPYYLILEEINAELGTDYTFPSAEQMKENGESYNDLIGFYTSMEIDEFKNYVLDAYNNEINGAQIDNYLLIKSTLYTGNGAERYSSIDKYGRSFSSYPYYQPTKLSSSINSGSRMVTCIFYCVKYTAKNLISATSYKITVTFSASGGHIYAPTAV